MRFLALAAVAALFAACGDSDDDATSAPPVVEDGGGGGGDGGTDVTDVDAGFTGTDAGEDGGLTATSLPSCRARTGPGIDTCGDGTTSESCCTTLALPSSTDRALDRYEITAGRLRAFVSAVADENGGQRNLRKWAKDYAAAHPASELGVLATSFPGLLEVLPDSNDPNAGSAVQAHLGATPIDPINTLDGCFMSEGGYGHATYWQPPSDLKPLGVGYGTPVDGVRKHPQSVLDTKPMNCVMPLLLAAFCAWDGGELARAADYHRIWGRRPVTLTNATVYVPWADIVPWGGFNWANGIAAQNCQIKGWPNCTNVQAPFFSEPAVANETQRGNDNSISIGAPGRFPKDITAITSANGKGWLDVGGNLMEAAWLDTPKTSTVADVCATRLGKGAGASACTRRPVKDGDDGDDGADQQGTKIYTGALPSIALVGYSFEGHNRRAEAFLSAAAANEALIKAGDLKPVTFQYGKVGGRCARPL